MAVNLAVLDNTVVTPHLAGATLDNIATVVARSVESAMARTARRAASVR